MGIKSCDLRRLEMEERSREKKYRAEEVSRLEELAET